MKTAAAALAPANSTSPAPNEVRAFTVIEPIKLHWRPAVSRQLNEYKPQNGEVFVLTDTMLEVRKGSLRVGVPFSNIRYVEFA